MRAERQPASVGGSMVQCAAMPAPLKGRFQAPKGRLWGVLMPPSKALGGCGVAAHHGHHKFKAKT